MIAYLQGNLAAADEKSCVIDVRGVGYLVAASAYTLAQMPPVGADVKIFTCMQVSENAVVLHGFLTREECSLFLMLLSVSGIGPKAAGQILATLNPQKLVMAIASEDVAAITKAPGVGKKTAQRLLLELRDKISAGREFVQLPDMPTGRQDAIDALCALGFSASEAVAAVMEVDAAVGDVKQIISTALKKLSGR